MTKEKWAVAFAEKLGLQKNRVHGGFIDLSGCPGEFEIVQHIVGKYGIIPEKTYSEEYYVTYNFINEDKQEMSFRTSF